MTGTRTLLREPIALAIIALALLMRVLVPGGWMPVAGQGFAVTLCTGTGMEAGWIDADGRVHKQKPVGEAGADQHCVFAGMAQAMLGGDAPAGITPSASAAAETVADALHLAVGQGLAAPPPPATGPPAHI